eukprot:Skav223791  [mRNA]  locus=scaffold575:454456:460599:+ [translate_table: standard]
MEMEVGGEDASDSESDDFRDDDQLDEAEDDCEDDGQLEDQRLAEPKSSARSEAGWSWSEAEDASLIEVVRAQLMEELFRKVYYAKVGWSEEQMALLRRSVRDLGYFHDDVQLKSWQTVVSRLGPGKSVEQCEALATKLGDMLRRHVPGRDLNDLCTRWTTLQCRIGDWTLEEDDALRGAIEKLGSNGGRGDAIWEGQLGLRIASRCDLLLATRRRVLSFSYGKKVQRQSTDLSASDFALHLTAESDQSARLTTGNRLADKHLSRINKKIASAGRATAERKRPLQDVLDDEASVGRPAKSAKKNPALCESEETEAKAPDSRRKSSKDSKGRKSAAQVKMELSDDGSHG